MEEIGKVRDKGREVKRGKGRVGSMLGSLNFSKDRIKVEN